MWFRQHTIGLNCPALPGLPPKPRFIVIEGRSTKLRQVGKDFRGYLPERWLSLMPGRWQAADQLAGNAGRAGHGGIAKGIGLALPRLHPGSSGRLGKYT